MPPQPPIKPQAGPPRWLDKLLEYLCDEAYLEEVLGDLHERYYRSVRKVGEAKARKLYCREALAYLRPAIYQRRSSQHTKPIPMDMLRSYLKLSFRSLIKHKVFSIINIVGLAIGIACCLLLFLYIQDETSYDQHHAHASDLYRITTQFHNMEGLSEHIGAASPPIAMAMVDEFPEVVNATRLVNPLQVDQNRLQYGEKVLSEDKGLIVDSTFFALFDFPLAAGDPQRALSKPNSVVLTQALAYKIFDTTEALGKVISIGNSFGKYDYQVTGILQDTDRNSHIEANFFTSIESDGLGTFVAHDDEWAGENFVYSYVQLTPEASPKALEAKLPAFLEKYGAADLQALGIHKSLHLQPVMDIHLRSHHDFELGQNGSIVYIYVLSTIALFVLFIACVNFVNLSTAKASQRANEVGVRKTLGASRSSLVRQFLGESMMIVASSVLLGVLLTEVLLPSLSNLTNKSLHVSATYWPYYLLAAVALTFVVGLLAGFYPALFLASFQPARVLKGKATSSPSSGLLRKALVVFQFVIAIGLISGVVIILGQINYMSEQPVGFEAVSRVVVPLRTPEVARQYDALKNRFSQQSRVDRIAAANIVPGLYVVMDMGLYPTGSSLENSVTCRRYFVDEDFVDVLQLQLLRGRNLDRNSAQSHHNPVLVNQLALEKMGIPLERAVGEKLYRESGRRKTTYEIIGVVNNFHQLSLREPTVPMVFEPGDSSAYRYLIASVHPSGMKQTLAEMKKTWQETVTDLPFEFALLDDQIQHQYENDRRMMKIIGSFTLIAILISCLGLYGLSAFVAERKVKEIGIRKVMGARVIGIVGLLSRDFTKLVLMAFLISVPLSYYAMNRWLQDFAYHIDIGPWFFAVAGMIALGIAWLTVGYHAIRAALANPVDSLRSE